MNTANHNKSAKEVINTAYKGKTNFMTPTQIDFGFVRNRTLAYELSRGNAMFGKGHMYGVSIVNVETGKPEYELGKGAFETIAEAKEYIKFLDENSTI